MTDKTLPTLSAATEIADTTLLLVRKSGDTSDKKIAASVLLDFFETNFSSIIPDESVTYAKMQHVSATDKILGRITAGAGDVEEITFTDQAQQLCDDTSFSAMRTTLGLGTGNSPHFSALLLNSSTNFLIFDTNDPSGFNGTITKDFFTAARTFTFPDEDGKFLLDSQVGTMAYATETDYYTTGEVDTLLAGAGDVDGPGSATDNTLARFDGSTGKIIQGSGVTVDDSNNVAGMASLTLTNTGLHILDTNASHDLIIAPGSDLSADRTLTLTTGDADRTLTINSNTTLGGGSHSGTNTGDQTSVTGNAGTATALQNARTIGGVSFDGTANIVPQTIQSVNEATDTTCFPLFITASGTQSLQPMNNTNLTFNSNTGNLGSTTYNKITFTAPASGATLTIADGVTLTAPTTTNVLVISGTAKLSVGTSTPTSPATGDLWVDTN